MIIGLLPKEGTTCSTVNQYAICDDRFINFFLCQLQQLLSVFVSLMMSIL